MKALLISRRPEIWHPLLEQLQASGFDSHFVDSMEHAQAFYRQTPPTLTVLDLPLDEAGLRAAVISLLMINAFASMAVVSDMDTETFHDRMEGLGLLGSIPHPDREHLATVLESWKILQ